MDAERGVGSLGQWGPLNVRTSDGGAGALQGPPWGLARALSCLPLKPLVGGPLLSVALMQVPCFHVPWAQMCRVGETGTSGPHLEGGLFSGWRAAGHGPWWGSSECTTECQGGDSLVQPPAVSLGGSPFLCMWTAPQFTECVH